MKNEILFVSIIVAILGANICMANEFCNAPSVKDRVLLVTRNEILRKPRPYVKTIAAYNSRTGSFSPYTCCIDYNAEPHPSAPNCFAAYRSFCYNLKTGALSDAHTYNGWCDY